MKTFITHLAIAIVSLYLIVVFISMTPNIMLWEVGGRAAFLFFALLFSIVSYSILESSKN